MTASEFEDEKEDIQAKYILKNIPTAEQKSLFLMFLYHELVLSDKLKGISNNPLFYICTVF